MAQRTRNAILLFGIVNAALYSALLPLWEGFDEPFHYGYVETLRSGRLPVLGRTTIPSDVFDSLRIAPVSDVVYRRIRQGIPDATPFTTWFALSDGEREHRRQALAALRPGSLDSPGPNYEAQQTPLAYMILVPLDWSISGLSLPIRVLVLRLFVAISSTVLLFFGTAELCRQMNLPEAFATALLLTIFSSEMLYATTAHIANDWLAVSISAWVFSSAIAFLKKPTSRSALIAAAWMAGGLVTKAYFLVFFLWAAWIVVAALWRHSIRLRTAVAALVLISAGAGPWYARNIMLYRDMSGTLQGVNGTGVKETVAAVAKVDWIALAGFLSRASIWTGNSSYTSYSRMTLNAMLALLALAILAWVIYWRAIQPAERSVFLAIVLFAAAMAYNSSAAFAASNGEYSTAGPWYSQVLLAPVMVLAYLGMARSNRMGRMLAICTVTIWSWILVATWTIKLFPMYSGGGSAPMRFSGVLQWYTHGFAAHSMVLSASSLATSGVLYCGLLASLCLGVTLSAVVIRLLWPDSR